MGKLSAANFSGMLAVLISMLILEDGAYIMTPHNCVHDCRGRAALFFNCIPVCREILRKRIGSATQDVQCQAI